MVSGALDTADLGDSPVTRSNALQKLKLSCHQVTHLRAKIDVRFDGFVYYFHYIFVYRGSRANMNTQNHA